MKKFILPFLITLTVTNLTCRISPCGDLPRAKPFFNVTGLNPLYIQVQSPTIWDVYKNVKVVEQSSKLWFTLNFNVEYYGSVKTEKPAFSLLNSAYACSPLEEGYKGSSEEYSTIGIMSTSDFDTNHLKGTDLVDLFLVPENGGPTNLPLITYIKKYPRLSSHGFRLYLGKRPDISKKHSFTFTVKLTNGETYTVESGEIVFQ